MAYECQSSSCIKIFVVYPSVCVTVVTDVGIAVIEFAGRVQINYVHFSFHRNEIVKLLLVGTLYVLQATRRKPLWPLAIALATGKNTRDYLTCRTRTRHMTPCREPLSRRAI